MTDAARFWAKVEPTGFCWAWTGGTTERGYGKFWRGGRLVLAHREAYALLVGPVPSTLVLDHLCRNHSCVNPDHLEPVTQAENLRRSPTGAAGRWAARQTCASGHPYTEDNTRRREDGTRVCRTCARLAGQRYRLRKKEA